MAHPFVTSVFADGAQRPGEAEAEAMESRVQRWMSLALCTVLCGGLSLVALAGASATAGAATPALLRRPDLELRFGHIGRLIGPVIFQLTNDDPAPDVISTTGTTVSGPAADDYFAFPDPQYCPSPDSSGNITLAPGRTCEFDVFFIPGALGQRSATINVADTMTSGVTLALNGTGTIGYYQVSSNGTVAHFGDATFQGDLRNDATQPAHRGHGRHR